MTKDDAIKAKAKEIAGQFPHGKMSFHREAARLGILAGLEMAQNALPDEGWDIDEAMLDRAETAYRIAPIDDRASVFLNHRVAIRAALEAAFFLPPPRVMRKINIDDLNALVNCVPAMLGYLTDNSCSDPDCCGGPFYSKEDYDQGVATLARFGLVYDGKA